MNEVLVLNRSLFAVHIISWQKAFCLIYKGSARVIDQDYIRYTFDEWVEMSRNLDDNHKFVRTIKFRVAIPDVIALENFDSLPKMDIMYSRKNIFKHYGCRCCFCGSRFKIDELTIDHVIPKSRGGKTDWSNTVVACVECNTRKADRTPTEAGMKMFYKCSRPLWRPAYANHLEKHAPIRESWKYFVDRIYH